MRKATCEPSASSSDLIADVSTFICTSDLLNRLKVNGQPFIIDKTVVTEVANIRSDRHDILNKHARVLVTCYRPGTRFPSWYRR